MIRWLRILDLAILFRSTLQGGNSWLRCIRCARSCIDAAQFGSCDVYQVRGCQDKSGSACEQ